MSHNPPRVWMNDAQHRAVEQAVKRKLAQWVSLDDLADKMLTRALAGKRVVLSPGTAEVVGRALRGKIGSEKK